MTNKKEFMCNSCLGCNRLEDKSFIGLYECEHYVSDHYLFRFKIEKLNNFKQTKIKVVKDE